MSAQPPRSAPGGAWTWIVDAGYALAAVLLLSMGASILGAVVPMPAWLLVAGTWMSAGVAWALVRSHDTASAPGLGRALASGLVAMALTTLLQPGAGAIGVWVVVDVVAGAALFAWAAWGASRWLDRPRPNPPGP